MLARGGWAGVVCLLASIGALPTHAADALAGRVLSATGRISLERGRDLWAMQPSDLVQPGEIIVTGPDGYALLQLGDGSKFEVFPDSRVVFRPNRGNWRDVIDIFLGKVRIHIEKIGGRPNPYRVNSATALIAVRGTVFEVGVAHDDTTTIAVEEGLVAVTHKLLPSMREVLVRSGEALVVHPGEPLTQASNISKSRIAVRVLSVALERALANMRLGGSRVPAPPTGGGSGTAGGGIDAGQAPPPPSDVPDGDTGPGAP